MTSTLLNEHSERKTGYLQYPYRKEIPARDAKVCFNELSRGARSALVFATKKILSKFVPYVLRLTCVETTTSIPVWPLPLCWRTAFSLEARDSDPNKSCS